MLDPSVFTLKFTSVELFSVLSLVISFAVSIRSESVPLGTPLHAVNVVAIVSDANIVVIVLFFIVNTFLFWIFVSLL